MLYPGQVLDVLVVLGGIGVDVIAICAEKLKAIPSVVVAGNVVVGGNAVVVVIFGIMGVVVVATTTPVVVLMVAAVSFVCVKLEPRRTVLFCR